MCTPASAFAVVALRSRPHPPLHSRQAPAPVTGRRRALGLLPAAWLAWFAAGRDGPRA